MTHMHCSCMSINSHLLVTVQEAWRREGKGGAGGEKRDKLKPTAAGELARPGLGTASLCEYLSAKRSILLKENGDSRKNK